MSKGISIKIDGKWAVVNEDAEISIEMSSPVLNEEGTFSLPFELPYEENRHLFGNLGEPDGMKHLYDLAGKEFELYFEDILLYYGIIDIEDGEEISDMISLSLVSGNAMLKDMVEGMKASDVEVMNKIYLGYTVERINMKNGTSFPLDSEVFMNYVNYNISDAYPIKPYCNVRVCYQPEGSNSYCVLGAKRPWSGVCFYLAYFFDCLWNKLGLYVKNNVFLEHEDLKRIAFFTTKCECQIENTTREIKDINVIKDFVDILAIGEFSHFSDIKDIYATGKNFPTIDISTIIESIQSAFGAKIIVDETGKGISIVLLKDIFTDNEVLDLQCEIISESTILYNKKGIIVKYAGAEEDDTSFNYDDWNNVKTFSDYKTVINDIKSNDMTLYVNSISGKKFRVKVNKDAETEDQWYPSLFEVAQFNQVKIGDADDDNCEEMEIGFSPIIMNDINFKEELKGIEQQVLAAFINVDMEKPATIVMLLNGAIAKSLVQTVLSFFTKNKIIAYLKRENYNESNRQKSPLKSLDSGFTLGIMRGPGNNAGIDIYKYDYDGNGNDAWVTVPDNYAFDEDYITNWNQIYDYNGSEPGIPYTDEMFSLKLRAWQDGLPISSQYKNRGLVDKFLTEYAYFLANHKTINITARMELSQLINLKWEKKYRVGQRIGYINHINYTLSNSGISDVTIELFTI